MEYILHVMLAGQGAIAFVCEQGLEIVEDFDVWFIRAGVFEDNYPSDALPTGIVGCVVRDGEGRLAVATSTAGVFGKWPGRVGDSFIIGVGAWADGHVAVFCTGQGEYFICVVVVV